LTGVRDVLARRHTLTNLNPGASPLMMGVKTVRPDVVLDDKKVEVVRVDSVVWKIIHQVNDDARSCSRNRCTDVHPEVVGELVSMRALHSAVALHKKPGITHGIRQPIV
jgi:hypothetical protein